MVKFSKRQLMEIEETLRGPTGQWLFDYLKQIKIEKVDTTISFIPANMSEMNEREQKFGEIKCLIDLLEQIPQLIKEQVKNSTDEN